MDEVLKLRQMSAQNFGRVRMRTAMSFKVPRGGMRRVLRRSALDMSFSFTAHAQFCQTDCDCQGIRKCCPLLYNMDDNALDTTYMGPRVCMPAVSRPEVVQIAKQRVSAHALHVSRVQRHQCLPAAHTSVGDARARTTRSHLNIQMTTCACLRPVVDCTDTLPGHFMCVRAPTASSVRV